MQTFDEAARVRPDALDCFAIFGRCDADLNCLGVIEPLSAETTYSLRVLSNHHLDKSGLAQQHQHNFIWMSVRPALELPTPACGWFPVRRESTFSTRPTHVN
jgi:hypothetical protein